MKTGILTAGILFLASFAQATNYTWTGGGNDGGKWTTPQNWGVASGYPNNELDYAIFNSSATVVLDTGADTSLRIFRVTSGTVTITGTDGGRLLFSKGYADGIAAGFDIQDRAVLNLGVPVVAGNRVDAEGKGTINYSSVLTGSGQYYLRTYKARLGKGATVDMAAYSPVFGMSANNPSFNVLFADDAQVNVLDFCPANGSAGTSTINITQDGEETTVATERDFYVNFYGNAHPDHYVLSNGTLTVGRDLCVTSASATGGGVNSTFVQEGGTVTVARDLVTNCGDYYLKGGTLTVTRGLLYGTKNKGAVYLSGGTLVYRGGTNSTTKAKLIVTGTNGVIKLPGSCTWASLGITALDDAVVRLEADSAVTVTIDADTSLPAGLAIGANVKVKVASGVSVVPDGQGTIPRLTINEGGVFACNGQSSRILVPIHLAINGSGQFKFDDGGYARTAVVAYSYTIDGVQQARSVYATSSTAGSRLYAATTTSTLWVPYVWTGAAGDGNFDNAANWMDGARSTWSSNVPIDLSQATGEIVLPECSTGRGYSGISYLPTQADSTLHVRGASEKVMLNLSVRPIQSYTPVAVCRKGCTLVLDVATKLYNTEQRSQAFGGGGTVWLRGEAINLFAVSYGLLLDVDLKIAGKLTTGTLCYSPNHDYTGDPRVMFEAGADVSITNYLSCDGSGFVPAMGYVQNGGKVSVKLLAMASTRDENTRQYNATVYTQNGGNLIVTDELRLGGRSPLQPTWGQKYGGTYVMAGGTAVVAKVTHELNSNYLKILNGDFTLGAGGVIRSSTNPGATKAQAASPIQVGAATLRAATASWSIDTDLTVELLGTYDFERPTLDVASELTATFNGPVCGTGGLVKRGAGSAIVNGAWSATGRITVEEGLLVFTNALSGVRTIDVRTGGALTLPATVPGNLRVSVPSADALTLSGNVTLEQLLVGGKPYAAGSYSFKGGTLTIAYPENTFVWIGSDGGDWSNTANWKDGQVPNDESAEVDFTFSDLSEVSSIAIDTPVVVKSLSLTSNMSLTGTSSLSFAADGFLEVGPGATLACGMTCQVMGVVEKRGAGKVVFANKLRCAADISTLTFPNLNHLKTVEGETELAGTLEGVRLEACSEVAELMPKVTISEGAVATNCCTIHGPYSGSFSPGFGEVVMNGGLADFDAGHGLYGMTGNQECGKSEKWAFSWVQSGETRFTINGGSLTLPNVWLSAAMNLNNTKDGGAKTTVTLNGGELIVPQQWFMGTQVDAEDAFVMNGGTLRATLFNVGAGQAQNGSLRFALNGGTFVSSACPLSGGTFLTNLTVSAVFPEVEVNGRVTFIQTAPDVTMKILPKLVGSGTLCQEGSGQLAFQDIDERLSLELAVGSRTGLAYTDTKVVKKLLIGGRGTKPNRLYGAGEEGTSFARPYFTGAGYLQPTERTAPLGLTVIVK